MLIKFLKKVKQKITKMLLLLNFDFPQLIKVHV